MNRAAWLRAARALWTRREASAPTGGGSEHDGASSSRHPRRSRSGLEAPPGDDPRSGTRSKASRGYPFPHR